MTFSYVDPADNRRDALRLLTGDTVAAQPLLIDEEIDYLLGVWGDYDDYTVAAYCAEAIAAKFAREIDINADGQSLAANALQEKYLQLAITLRSQAARQFPGAVYVGGIDPWETAAVVAGVEPPAFGTQMHDHPEAGQQDFGDYRDRYPYSYEDWREQWQAGGRG